MSIEADLVTYLASKAAVTTYVGTPNPRIFPESLPQKFTSETRYPALIYRTLDDGRQHDLGGGAGFATPTIQLIAVDDDMGDANGLAEAVRGVLQGQGPVTMGSSTAVSSVTCANASPTDAEPLDDGGDRKLYAVPRNYRLLYKEAVP